MKSDRRKFLKALSTGGAVTLFSVPGTTRGEGESFPGWPDSNGVLVDISLCIGCRKCEEACKNANGLAPVDVPLEDLSIFEEQRRMDEVNYTVVNRFPNKRNPDKPVFVKRQCMHCNEPACAAACLVGALSKCPDGAVVYNKDVCLGCRYCMVACPFNVPAYEYHNAFSPQVRKCTLCHERFKSENKPPACVSICPQEVMVFGPRKDLLNLARERIANHPEKYQDHIYGASEAGGTSWLYLSDVPFEDLGFPTNLGTKAFPEYTRGFLSMIPGVLILWPALLSGFYAFLKNKGKSGNAEHNHSRTLQERSQEEHEYH